VLALPGVRPVLVAAFVGRLPIGMLSLSIVLRVSRETGSYATAGAVAATQALAGGIASPLLGRLIDRIGQTPVLVGCAVGFPLCVAALIAVASTVDDLLPLIAVAVPFGVTYPLRPRGRLDLGDRGPPMSASSVRWHLRESGRCSW
jgi:MFS family permease